MNTENDKCDGGATKAPLSRSAEMLIRYKMEDRKRKSAVQAVIAAQGSLRIAEAKAASAFEDYQKAVEREKKPDVAQEAARMRRRNAKTIGL